MTYPTSIARTANYYQDEQANLTSPDPAKVDTEMNDVFGWSSEVNALLRSITTASGLLKNVAAATAQSLAGSQTFTATAAQTDFLTTIDYLSTFTSDNVAVFRNGLRIANSGITVASGTGTKLQVTIAASTAGDIIQVDAYESGSGLLTKLASTATGEGAALIGVKDSTPGIYTATDVNAALLEVMVKLNALITAVGSTGNLLKADGSVPMTGNLAMGARNITGLAAGSASGHAVEYDQFNAVASAWADLTANYLQLDGDAAMTDDLDMGTNSILNVVDPTTAQGAATKNYTDTTFVPLAGDVTLTGTLGGADPVAATDYVTQQVLDAAVAPITGFPNIKTEFSAGTTSWTVPANITKIRAHAIGPGGGGGTYGVSRAGGGGGYAGGILTVVPGHVLSLVVGAGGAAGADGSSATTLTDSNTSAVLLSAGPGTALGVGGGGTVGPLLLNGGAGGYAYNQGAGGRGAGPYGGDGGPSAVGAIAGLAGTSPGGGGGASGSSAVGAAGAPGAIIIEY